MRPRSPRGEERCASRTASCCTVPPGTTSPRDRSRVTSLRELLILVYPQKKPEDFWVQPYTFGLVFHTSGLAVDLVPVVPIPDEPGYGWQPSSKGDDPIKTSISGQFTFIEDTAKADPRYRTLVRLAKKWRNQQELDALRSFMIELILAWIQGESGPDASLEEGIQRFFLYLHRSGLQESIGFEEGAAAAYGGSEPVVILDPVNRDNNVARRITDAERVEIVQAAGQGWETLCCASTHNNRGDTLELWKEVFGRSFKVEE